MQTEKNFKQRTLQPRFFLIIAIFAFSTQFVRPLVPQLSDWWFILLWIVVCIVAVIIFGVTVTRVVVPPVNDYDQPGTTLGSMILVGASTLIYQNPTITGTWLFALLWTIACLLVTFLIGRIPRLPRYLRDKTLPMMLIFPGTAFFVRSLVPFMHRLPFLLGWTTLGFYAAIHINLWLTRRRPRW